MLLALGGCLSRPATARSDHDRPGRVIVIDTHSDCTQRIAYGGIDFATAQPDMQVDLPKMRAGGLDAQFFSPRALARRAARLRSASFGRGTRRRAAPAPQDRSRA